MTDTRPTFIVDCPVCKAKVAATEYGRISRGGDVVEGVTHYGVSVGLGCCPKCHSILVGESQQISVAEYEGDDDEWADPVRVYPDPPKAFTSPRIPKVVSESITEGLKSMQGNANVAACAMFGRALEGICRDLLGTPIMLGEGLRKLKEGGLIDQQLFDWSEQLYAFRNLAAHPTDNAISREEAEDLGTFVIAIVVYIYDLTDRYNEFKERQERKKQR